MRTLSHSLLRKPGGILHQCARENIADVIVLCQDPVTPSEYIVFQWGVDWARYHPPM